MNLHVEVTSFKDHVENFKDKTEGQKVVLLKNENGETKGDLVWRIASGYTVEICEFGIHKTQDRRQGLGTKLLQAGLEDMQEYYRNHLHHPHKLRRVWLLTEARNNIARAFYKACGFHEEAVLKNFYIEGDAILCVLIP